MLICSERHRKSALVLRHQINLLLGPRGAPTLLHKLSPTSPALPARVAAAPPPLALSTSASLGGPATDQLKELLLAP